MELSVLNLAPLRQGETYKDAIDNSIQFAKEVEELGYCRYWLAEHHNTPAFASSATALLIQAVLEHTKKIRVGSGGVMLPNHSPYVVAEYYGTLETMYPGRVDLGLGRAPGTDHQTAMVLRRTGNLYSDFEAEVKELESYFKDTAPVRAYPAAGLDVPFYILGSSTESAYLAAKLGLPYAFAAHFAPRQMEQAVYIYRRNFKPSQYLGYPYVILGVNVLAADTDEEARRLSTTGLYNFIDITTGQSRGLLPPAESEEAVWDTFADEILSEVPHFGPVKFNKELIIHNQKAAIEEMRKAQIIGSAESIVKQYLDLKKRAPFDELMVTSFIYDHDAQWKSYKLFKDIVDEVERKNL